MTQSSTLNVALELADFPLQTFDTIRYGDTDRQGHVNNAVFASFLETGRVMFLYNPEDPLLEPNAAFVIAGLQLNFLAELHWPGRIDIGTGIVRIGNSSLTLIQGLFQQGLCVARAETIIVQMNETTRRSQPLSPVSKQRLQSFLID